ncbi:calsyntenin-3-like [Dipodomys spectabilis]|uniref:calsyntenin-3-like n=1 Tax=Dipodomys spectabilis TaxID=105255 RepID=UPI001C54B121|nr:calsyntenin-3-like [Dipodomys spectabilis]
MNNCILGLEFGTWRSLGNIENTEKLQYSGEKLYKFTVTAYDCGKKRAADDAEVEIQVKPTCKPSWQGWNKRIEYTPGAGSLALFPGIHLETCDEPLWNIQATVELQTSHVGKGCDRDNYSERALRKLCGAATGEVDLLPMPGPNANWTAGLSVQYSQDSSLIYWFNGTQAVQVPVGSPAGPGSAPIDGLSDHFTLSFWMKHGVAPSKAKKEEETILCHTVQNEDGFSHYSLTVHGCRIAFLYWPLLDSARPVKFLWKLEQVCDDGWHHYALNLEFPTVTLYTDGISFDPALIHDNGLIHPPRRDPALMIGACWTEENKKERGDNATEAAPGDPLSVHHYFHGYLAGFSVRAGHLENRAVIQCLYACREGLDYRDFENLGKGMKVHMNPSQSLLTLEGDDVETFNHALQHVDYMNTLRFATPGVRPLRLTTAVKCDEERNVERQHPFSTAQCARDPDARELRTGAGSGLHGDGGGLRSPWRRGRGSAREPGQAAQRTRDPAWEPFDPRCRGSEEGFTGGSGTSCPPHRAEPRGPAPQAAPFALTRAAAAPS